MATPGTALADDTEKSLSYAPQVIEYDYVDGDTKTMRMRNNYEYKYYFTQPYTAESGLLHFSYKMKDVNNHSINNNANKKYSFVANGKNVSYANKYNKEFRIWKQWQGIGFNAKLNAHVSTGSVGTYDAATDTWSGGTISGDGPEVYSTVDAYVDLTNQKIAIIFNGNIGIKSFALDPDVAYSSGDEEAYLALNNTYYHASLYHYNQLRSVHSAWRYYWTNYNPIKTMGTTKDDYKCPIEAYIDLSSGKAAIKYGADGKFELINIPEAVIDNGISSVQGTGSKQYIDDVTVKKYEGNIYDVAVERGVDLGVASLPAFYDYENSTANTTVELATKDNPSNKAHIISPSNTGLETLTIPFRDVVKEGKLYIGFDYAEKKGETTEATTGSGKRYFSISDANGTKYRIAGINLTHVGMQSYSSNDWQANIGATEIDRKTGVWHHIDMVIDFESGIMSGYLNGKLLAQVAMVNSGITKDWSGLLKNGASALYIHSESITNSEYCLDNIKLTNFTEGLTMKAGMKDSKNIDVDFGTSLTANELAFYTTVANWDNAANITSVTQITPSKLRLTLNADVTDTAYHYITIPDFVQNGVTRKAEGVASVTLNDNLICYTQNDLVLESTSFTGCDGNLTYPLSVEPGTTAVNLVFNSNVTTANEVTLKQGETTVGTASYNGKKCTVTLEPPLVENTTYTLSFKSGDNTYSRNFTTGEGKLVVTDYAFVDENGAEISELTTGGNLRLSVKNTTSAAKSVYAIVAWYGYNNEMFGAVPKKVDANAYGAVADCTIPFDFGEDAASVNLVKAMFWNDLEEIMPIADRMEVVVETTDAE